MDAHHQQIADTLASHAQLVTYAGSGATLVFWGLHVNEICAVISTAVAVIGLGMQIWNAWRRHCRRTFH
jgi:uncharacterized membrane protein